ncbi:integral membrane protein [Mycobacterium tuberculosis]|nr:integral membrane protein [Mycobacterium tuberculosis]
MRGAGLIVAVQGGAALVVAAALLVRGLAGADQHIVNGLGTAGWFVLVGGAVLAAGCRLAVFAQLLLLPVAWYLIVGSHQPAIGIPVGIIALGVLVLLFSPPSIRWAAGRDQRGAASAANRGPDSR